MALAAGASLGPDRPRPSVLHAEAPNAQGLNPDSWTPLKLSKVTPLTHNTAIYRFVFDDPQAPSGLTVASCLVTKAPIGSENPDGSRVAVIRPYTPITRPQETGYVDLAIKTYPDGKMSKYIADLKVGDTLDFKGPIVKLPYNANEHDAIGMVAGGTGIAPMLQVVDEVLENPEDKTKISLIFANVSEEDILLKDSIDAKAAAHPGRLAVLYVVDKATPGSGWAGGVGYVTREMLEARMPPKGLRSKIFVCGPPPMYAAICGQKGTKEDPKVQGQLGGILKDMGYTEEDVFKF